MDIYGIILKEFGVPLTFQLAPSVKLCVSTLIIQITTSAFAKNEY